MGHRSWLTPIKSIDDWFIVEESIKNNPYANGIHYIIKIEREGTPFKINDVVVAWSGDGSSSLEPLRPFECRRNTFLLENFLDDYPEWHTEPGGPEKYGTYLHIQDEIMSHFWSLEET